MLIGETVDFDPVRRHIEHQAGAPDCDGEDGAFQTRAKGKTIVDPIRADMMKSLHPAQESFSAHAKRNRRRYP